MQTSYRPLTTKQKAELKGYISPGTTLFGVGLFLVVVALAASVFHFLHAKLVRVHPAFASPGWWVVPTVIFGVCLFIFFWKLRGGRKFGDDVRNDLSAGKAAVHHIEVIDAIEVEEGNEEGPSFFVLTSERKTLHLGGQWFYGHKRRGFPWKSFEIEEAPESRIFFGIKQIGERIPPSFTRQPLDWETAKRLEAHKGNYRFLDVDFESLKINPVKPVKLTTKKPYPRARYFGSNVEVALGDYVMVRVLFSRGPGRMAYVPGISTVNEEFDFGGLKDVYVDMGERMSFAIRIDPETGEIPKKIRFVRRADGPYEGLPPDYEME